MSDDNAPLKEKLDQLEAVLSGLASSTLAIADRVELLRQECGRSAAQIQRLGLNQESSKVAAQRREDALRAISDELAAIRSVLEKRPN